jgi:hypothetical protein
MKFMIKYVLPGILLFINLSLLSQDKESYINIVRAESELDSMFETMYNEEILGTHITLFKKIDSLFFATLILPGSFEYKWERLDKIGKLKSDDEKVKVFSWLYMQSRNDYLYSAYIQFENKKGEYEVIKLLPSNSETRYSEEFLQNTENWHGKIYYDMLTTEYKRKVFYTLLGADFNNIISSFKTIEVVAIQRDRPVFRGDQFLVGGKVKDRIVIEFSSEIAVSLRYNPDLGIIVHDHLAPLHPIYQGNYQFYGPDGSYDGYLFEEGIWVMEEDVDARNKQ